MNADACGFGQSANRTDVLSPGTMLDGKSCALSLEESVGLCSETGETVALGDLLAGAHEDLATAAARNIDWAEFLMATTVATPRWCDALLPGSR